MIFTNKDLFRIILPLFVEQLLAVTIGMLDSMMVSSVGEAAVSGVSLVDTLNLLLNYIFSALATGGAVILSQFLGRKEYGNARSASKQLLYSIVLTATFIMTVALVFRKPLLSLIFGKVGSDVMGHARIYFLFTAVSYPFLALYNGGAALFRSMGNSRVSMIASIIMNLLNVAGNALLIYVFGLGAAGAAISTLVSRVVGSFMMTALLHNRNNIIYIEKLFSWRPDFKVIKELTISSSATDAIVPSSYSKTPPATLHLDSMTDHSPHLHVHHEQKPIQQVPHQAAHPPYSLQPIDKPSSSLLPC